MNEVINTVRLTKHYGPVRAVENISLSVRKGEIYGFLGLNGAGKTTTIRMLLGMIHPTSGVAYLNGEKVGGGEIQRLESGGIHRGNTLFIPRAHRQRKPGHHP